MIFQEHGSSFYVNIEEKVWLLVKKLRTEKTDRATKTFSQKLGDFIETKAKKSLTSPGLVSPGNQKLWIEEGQTIQKDKENTVLKTKDWATGTPLSRVWTQVLWKG